VRIDEEGEISGRECYAFGLKGSPAYRAPTIRVLIFKDSKSCLILTGIWRWLWLGVEIVRKMGVGRELLGENFYGYIAVSVGIVSLKNGCHASSADLPNDSVITECAAYHGESYTFLVTAVYALKRPLCDSTTYTMFIVAYFVCSF